MSLFERIKYKRYDLQEVKKKMGGGSNTEGSGGGPRTRTRTRKENLMVYRRSI